MNRCLSLLVALPLLLPVLAHAQSAVDERAIITAVAELDAALDAKDWDRVRALLLDEVSVVLPGEEEAKNMPADELVEIWRSELHDDKASFHLRGGDRVVFDGADSAVLRSKAHVWQRLPGVAGDEFYERWADYHHELDRTEDGWRVRHHGVSPRLERGNLAVLEHRQPEPVEPPGDAPAAESTGDAPDEAAEPSPDTDDTTDTAPEEPPPPADGGDADAAPDGGEGGNGADTPTNDD